MVLSADVGVLRSETPTSSFWLTEELWHKIRAADCLMLQVFQRRTYCRRSP